MKKIPGRNVAQETLKVKKSSVPESLLSIKDGFSKEVAFKLISE